MTLEIDILENQACSYGLKSIDRRICEDDRKYYAAMQAAKIEQIKSLRKQLDKTEMLRRLRG